MRIKNIIFDWSGTLSDDLDTIVETVNLVFKELGAGPISVEKYREEFSLPYDGFWNKVLPEVPMEKINKLFSESSKKTPPPTVYPDVKETLEQLYHRGKRMFVLSSHAQQEIEKEARAYGIYDFLTEIKGSVPDKGKVIQQLLKDNQCIERETIYVGDMVHDIETGNAAQLQTVAITWGYQSSDKLLTANPNHIINNIKGIHAIVNA